jgi:hypothetical protein
MATDARLTTRTAVYFAHAAVLTLAAITLLSLTSCGLTPSEVWVYIDNAGNEPLQITVDNEPKQTAAAGECTKLVLQPGEHRFLITSGDEVLCDLTRNLEKSERFAACRKYLFNPDKLTRYQTYEAKYGVNRFQGVMQAGLLQYQKDPQIKRQYIYRQLLKEVKLVPSDAWNDVTGIDYVLTAPPEYVYTKGTARRSVLSRVSPLLYERMERMAQIDHPSEEDLERLDELLNEMFEDAL